MNEGLQGNDIVRPNTYDLLRWGRTSSGSGVGDNRGLELFVETFFTLCVRLYLFIAIIKSLFLIVLLGSYWGGSVYSLPY